MLQGDVFNVPKEDSVNCKSRKHLEKKIYPHQKDEDALTRGVQCAAVRKNVPKGDFNSREYQNHLGIWDLHRVRGKAEACALGLS